MTQKYFYRQNLPAFFGWHPECQRTKIFRLGFKKADGGAHPVRSTDDNFQSQKFTNFFLFLKLINFINKISNGIELPHLPC